MRILMCIVFLTAIIIIIVADGRRMGRTKCREEKFERRHQRAKFAFTGTVERLEYRNNDSNSTANYTYSASVKVKRVLKGDEAYFTARKFRVWIDNFGNGAFCQSHVKSWDTRIFLASGSTKGRLKITSSPIRLTLNNIKKAEAAIKDIPYKPRPPIPEEPCEKTYCAFGSVCMVDDVSKEAYCKCQETCGPVFAPVCGSDGVKYTSECQLRLASCTKQKRIVVEHKGPCDSKDPCESKVCRFGARCVPSLDGHTAECVCPEKCNTYGDHRGSSPVCGNDGNDYANLCELRRSACKHMREIEVKFHGKCDPCEGVQCSSMQVCQLDENRHPNCKCNGVCTMDFQPVCGSDGKTYSNECIMRVEACKERKNLRIVSRGECSSVVNPCSSLTCPTGQLCDIDRYGIATCKCPDPCQHVMKPVCGSDGVTYDNECELHRSACLKRRTIEVDYLGICGTEGPCNGVRCNFGAMCVVKDDEAVCDCPTCSAEFQPVCGSDGISYNNDCKLKLEACWQKKEISVSYQGLCNGCEDMHCQHYSICESDGAGGAKCVCPQTCVQVDDKVCGSDGISYLNECELKVAACKKQQFISVAGRGPCEFHFSPSDLCQNVHCKFGARCHNGQCVCPTQCPDNYEPVCSKESITYTNECLLRKDACQKSKEFEILFYGECDDITSSGNDDLGSGNRQEECEESSCRFGGLCEYDAEGALRCVCAITCETDRSNPQQVPVCGTDGRLYGTECELKLEACRHQIELGVQTLEVCTDVERPPCDGERPLVNPVTHVDYYCGEGPRRDECPAGSYCHKSPRGKYAKCCKNGDTETVIKSCLDSSHGCCPDGRTAALGPSHAGCPSVCKCNKLGSYGETCDAVTRQCSCKPGVGGLRCDRCEPGFWGLPKISEGNSGCIPCGCSMFGSVRDDCEQMTGRCVCKPGVAGMKCVICPDGQVLGPNGCAEEDLSTPIPQNCDELSCFFGAVCEERLEHAECICNAKCSEPVQESVCGSDGQTYGSECQLKLFACRYQKDIVVRALRPCTDDMIDPTELPLRRSTARRTTDIGEYNSLAKSTRHLEHNIADNLISTRPTSTAPIVKGLIGDICFRDKECTVPFTRCRDGWCDCREGYHPSPDRQQCKAQVVPAKGFPELPSSSACFSQPCLNGGTCHMNSNLTFYCVCPDKIKGVLCDDVPVFELPAFSGKSFLELKKMRAYSQVTVDVEFRTYANDGILIYNGQKADGQGDFISLSIKDGYVEFRYNLGSGLVVIRSLHKIRMKKFHRVTAKRFHRDGMLRLDGFEDVTGRSQGILKSLDLKQSLYVGFVPAPNPTIFENVGVSMGLVGCIKRLKIGRKEISLKFPGSRDIIRSVDVGECGENPCVSLPCQNGGTCMAIDKEKFQCTCLDTFSGQVCENSRNPCSSNPCAHGSTCALLPQGGFTCKCPPGRKGSLCEELEEDMHDVFVADFDSQSFVELPPLQNAGHMFSLEVWFLSRSRDGVLLYNGQLTNGRGDYLALNLVNGHVQFVYDLGSGPANITSPDPISLGEWHSAKASRRNRKGILQIDDGPMVTGESMVIEARLNELNVELSMYVGGFDSMEHVNQESRVAVGLNGAIQRVIINGEVYENLSKSSVSSRRITRYQGPPCLVNPCLNGGICQPRLGDFVCKCTMKFMGRLCDRDAGEVDLDRPVAFDGKTFLKYPNRIIRQTNQSLIERHSEEIFDEIGEGLDEEDEAMGQTLNRFEIRFKTNESNGLMVWMNKGLTLQGDYFAIALVDGHVELMYNLGKQKELLIVRTQLSVNDGQWHSVVVVRKKRLGTIQVDSDTLFSGTSDPGATVLNTDGNLWIGGSQGLPTGLPQPYYVGFSGCMDEVKVDGEKLHLVIHGENTIRFCAQD